MIIVGKNTKKKPITVITILKKTEIRTPPMRRLAQPIFHVHGPQGVPDRKTQ